MLEGLHLCRCRRLISLNECSRERKKIMGLLRWARAPFAAVTLLRPLSQCMLFLLRLSFKGGSLDGCPWCHFLSTLGLLEVDGQVGVTCSHDTQSCAIGVHRMPVTGTVSFFL